MTAVEKNKNNYNSNNNNKALVHTNGRYYKIFNENSNFIKTN